MRRSAIVVLLAGLTTAAACAGPLSFVTEGPVVAKARAPYADTFNFGDEPPMHVATVDLNGDSLNDMVVFIDNAGFCKSDSRTDSCTPVVFLNKAFWGWEKLDFRTGPSVGDWNDWSVLDETLNGFRLLVGPEHAGPVKYGWVGDGYVSMGPVKPQKIKTP